MTNSNSVVSALRTVFTFLLGAVQSLTSLDVLAILDFILDFGGVDIGPGHIFVLVGHLEGKVQVVSDLFVLTLLIHHLEVNGCFYEFKHGFKIFVFGIVALFEIPASLEVESWPPCHYVDDDLHQPLLADDVAGMLEGIHVG